VAQTPTKLLRSVLAYLLIEEPVNVALNPILASLVTILPAAITIASAELPSFYDRSFFL
jgi:hypothetical protein